LPSADLNGRAGVDRARLSDALAQLPDTADELNAIAKSLGVAAADIHLGEDAKPRSSARHSPITASSISPPMVSSPVTSKGLPNRRWCSAFPNSRPSSTTACSPRAKSRN
jgi:hypothetical protein